MQATHRGLRAEPQVRLRQTMANLFLFSQTNMWALNKASHKPISEKKKKRFKIILFNFSSLCKQPFKEIIPSVPNAHLVLSHKP